MTYLIPNDPAAMIAVGLAALTICAIGAFAAWRVRWWHGEGWGDE